MFPVDEMTLDLVEQAIATPGGDAAPGELTMLRLLDFLSGYDESKLLPTDNPEVFEYSGGPIFSRDDVILALIGEVRRLRLEVS